MLKETPGALFGFCDGTFKANWNSGCCLQFWELQPLLLQWEPFSYTLTHGCLPFCLALTFHTSTRDPYRCQRTQGRFTVVTASTSKKGDALLLCRLTLMRLRRSAAQEHTSRFYLELRRPCETAPVLCIHRPWQNLMLDVDRHMESIAQRGLCDVMWWHFRFPRHVNSLIFPICGLNNMICSLTLNLGEIQIVEKEKKKNEE